MRRIPRVFLPVAVIALAATLVALWLLLSALSVFRSASAIQALLPGVVSAVEQGDDPAFLEQARQLQTASRDFQAATSSPAWTILQQLPIVGGTAAAIEGLAAGTVPLADAAVRSATTFSAEDEFSAAVMRVLQDQETIRQMRTGLAQASQAASTLTAQTFVRPVVTLLRPISNQISSADRALAIIEAADPSIHLLLGSEEPQQWLAVFVTEEASELSALTPISYALLTADDGRLIPVASGVCARQTPVPRGEDLVSFARNCLNSSSDVDALDGVMLLDESALRVILDASGPVGSPGESTYMTDLLDLVATDKQEDTTTESTLDRYALLGELLGKSISQAASSPQEPVTFLGGINAAIKQGHLALWIRPATDVMIDSQG
jgi:hypothetical protein